MRSDGYKSHFGQKYKNYKRRKELIICVFCGYKAPFKQLCPTKNNSLKLEAQSGAKKLFPLHSASGSSGFVQRDENIVIVDHV